MFEIQKNVVWAQRCDRATVERRLKFEKTSFGRSVTPKRRFSAKRSKIRYVQNTAATYHSENPLKRDLRNPPAPAELQLDGTPLPPRLKRDLRALRRDKKGRPCGDLKKFKNFSVVVWCLEICSKRHTVVLVRL